MKLVVISGLSGSGKSVALHALEDLGYYCVDNLPLALLPALAAELRPGRPVTQDFVAVVVDARNSGGDFARFAELMAEVRGAGVEAEVVYLEADDSVLIQRFSETRRRHPLTGGERSLAEALAREREILEPVSRLADVRLDTSGTHLHQLRDLVRTRVDRRPAPRLELQFQSFGYKHGVPPDADMVFDVRCLPNPHWEPGLRTLNGRDAAVQQFLERQPAVLRMYDDLRDFVGRWVPAFEAGNRPYLTVAIGCTGGQHRSVFLAERLAEHFRSLRGAVLLRHRQLG